MDFAADSPRSCLHIGLFGGTGVGKDNLLRVWFASLAQRNHPVRVQFAVLDGKGDWLTPSLASLAHFFHPPAGGYGQSGDDRIRDLISCLDAEAERRQKLITSADCVTYEQYVVEVTGDPMPLLVVISTDMMTDVSKDTEGLWQRLVAKGRALGIRVVISMQTPTRQDTRWRSVLSTIVCGALSSGSQDEPAMGLPPRDLKYRPSELPPPEEHPGTFVVRRGRNQWRVQAPYLPGGEWQRIVKTLPKKDASLEKAASPDHTWTIDHERVHQWMEAEGDLSQVELAKRLRPGSQGVGRDNQYAGRIKREVLERFPVFREP
jgi:hypothetical protein